MAAQSRDAVPPEHPAEETGSSKRPARPTSYDVAMLSGVSQSTVSRVFRDGAPVSKATRKKVEAAAQALNYSPSQIARSLITQRTNLIGVVITDPSNRAYPDVLFYLGQEIQASGSRMLVVALPRDGDTAIAVREILAYHVDGIVSSAVLDDSSLEMCAKAHVPVVLFNRTRPNMPVSAVCCDHNAGMEMLVGHLAVAPTGQISLLAGPEWAPVSQDRLQGAVGALTRRGIAVGKIMHSDYTFEGGRQSARELLSASGTPQTVICANDAMALGVMDACRFELGLRVPEDVAVTGFDDIPQSDWPSYRLTTVRQPVRRMAKATVRMLTELIDGTGVSGERRLLPPELRIRATTRETGAGAPAH